MGNSRSLAFWSAMDAESSSFQYYAGDRSPENREKYELSCARTRSALKSLPFASMRRSVGTVMGHLVPF